MQTTRTKRGWTESERLAALDRYSILDTPPDPAYDNVVQMLARLLEVPIAAVSLVANGRQWFKAEFGLGLRETPICDSICAFTILQHGTFVVPDASRDSRFAANSLVRGQPGIRFYAGELLETPDGYPLGALCVLDVKPRPEGLTAQQQFILKTLAQQVMAQLELHRRISEQSRILAVQRRMEAELRAERERSLQLLEGMNDGFLLMDSSFRVLQVNSGLLRLEQRPASEIIGHSYWEMWSAAEQNGLKDACRRAVEQQAPANVEQCRVFPDGRIVWLDIRILPTESGLAMLYRDITEGKNAEFALRRSEQRLAAIFSQAAVGMVEADARGILQRVNNAMCDMLGRPQEALLGRSFADVTHPDDLELSVDCVHRALNAGDSFTIEKRYMRPDGSWFWGSCNLARIVDADGNTRGIIAVVSDISKRKRAEECLQQLASELSEADRHKTEFLATLAHELRNPLAPLRNGLEVMQLAGDNLKTIARVREMMERQVRHMAHLIDDLLDVARITRGKLELKKEMVELKTIVVSAIETSQPLIDGSRHHLTVELPEQPLMLDADPTRIAQVISNLLNNAAKYTPAGGKIMLTIQQERQEAVICVSDTGIGIPSDVLPQIFNMFTQAGSNPQHHREGLGIGLTLVRRLVELHGGSVTAASGGTGKGSCFTVRLPLVSGQLPQTGSCPGRKTRNSMAAISQYRIIVADDNADAARSLADLLEMRGHTVGIANDGQQAIRLVHESAPDIIFLDIGMPGMDGYQVARTIRNMAGMRDVVLVAMTGWGTENDRNRSRQAGLDHHLTKPAAPEAIDNVLYQLDRRRRERPSG